MNILSMLGADTTTTNTNVVWSWAEYLQEAGEAFSWVETLVNVLSTVLWIALALVGAAGAIYATYVGIKMARADSAEAREENKKRLINIIVSIVVTIALILFFNIFLPAILSAVRKVNTPEDIGGSTAIAETAKLFLRM